MLTQVLILMAVVKMAYCGIGGASVQLTAPQMVSEADVSAQVCVQLIPAPGETSGDIGADVMIVTMPGTAMSPEDFLPLNVTFDLNGSGDLQACDNIMINPDDLLEGRESLSVLASYSITENGVVTVPAGSALSVVFILDNSAVSLGFAEPSYTFSEGESSPQVCVVVLEGTIVRELPVVTAMVTSVPGTAIGSEDYSVISMSVELTRDTPPSGSCFALTLVNDDALEMIESFTLALSSLVSDTRVDDTLNGTEIVIADDDAISLTVNATFLREQDGVVEACIQLQGSPAEGARTVLVATVDDTAVATSASSSVGDYEPINMSLVFPKETTELRQCVPIIINVDGNLEQVEMFFVIATEIGNPQSGEIPTQFVIIQSEDTITIGFEMSNYTFVEGDPPDNHQVCVVVSEGEIQGMFLTTEVTVSACAGTALSDSDYVFANMTLVFDLNTTPEGVCLTLDIVNDTSFEETEEFILKLTSAEGIVNIMQGETAIIIEDDDLVVCPTPPTLIDGTLMVSPPGTSAPGTTVTYTCNLGFILEGVDMLVCQMNGMWMPAAPGMCRAVNCGPLIAPENGQVMFSSTSFASMATYTCNEGFSRTAGDVMRICRLDETWSGVEPTCTMDPTPEPTTPPPVDCGRPPCPPQGYVRFSSTTVNSIATYFCYVGYKLDRAATRQCLPDGTWSGRTPRCDPVFCPLLSIPDNSRISRIFYTWGLRVVSSAYYYCPSGYRLRGNRRRVCRPTGRWTGSTPSCTSRG